KTYNTRYSLIVTDSTTNPALTGLSMGERTGSRVFQWVWSYVLKLGTGDNYIVISAGAFDGEGMSFPHVLKQGRWWLDMLRIVYHRKHASPFTSCC
ncbi:hypothetical protein LY78DRAFT_588023, partial [Colletotrichum sublineola]